VVLVVLVVLRLLRVLWLGAPVPVLVRVRPAWGGGQDLAHDERRAAPL
jgi:hypothetical protein